MAQQLSDLLKSFSDMSNNEQLDLVRAIRNRKHSERPAAARRQKKAKQPALNKAKKLLDGLSAEDIMALLGEEGE